MIKNQRYQLLCQNVKALREAHNLSLEEMAQILNIPVMSLKKFESGIITRRIGVDLIFRIESHFNVSPKELFTTALKCNE